MEKRIYLTENQYNELLEKINSEKGDIFVDEITENNLKKIINEELGISYDVEYVTKNLAEMLESLMFDKQGVKIGDAPNAEKYVDKNVSKCYGIPIIIEYEIVNFKIKEDYYAYTNKKYNGDVGFVGQYGTYKFNFNLVSINKKLDKEFVKMIQHEIHHFYEIRRAGKDNLIKDKYKSLYDRVCVELSKVGNNGNEYKICYAIYMCFESEQRAFMNNLDRDLKYCAGLWKSDLAKTDIYTALKMMREMLEKSNENEALIKKLLNMEVGNYQKLLSDGIKKLEWRIGRIVARNRNKELNEGINRHKTFYYKS